MTLVIRLLRRKTFRLPMINQKTRTAHKLNIRITDMNNNDDSKGSEEKYAEDHMERSHPHLHFCPLI